jgi:serine protease Do
VTELRKVIGYVFVFVGGFTSCALVLYLTGNRTPRLAAASAPGASLRQVLDARPAPLTPLSGLPSVADAAAKVEPAVVNIDVSGRRKNEGGGPFAFLRRGETEEFEGSGSGILISADGYVVTNNHVVAEVADGQDGEITIRLDNDKEFRNVTIVGRDPMTDLAVLKIHGATDLPTAELGDSDSLRVGDWAIAVGNPLGFNSSVTLGIISALNRRNLRSESDALDRVIQTDAAINPGNSGGALADTNGRVIGINTAIASQTGGSVGIGFAIPINAAKRIIDQLIQSGKVVRPYLGIVYAPVEGLMPEDLPDGISLPNDRKGAIILGRNRQSGTAILPNSPAAKAGLQEFDIIRAIDGKPVDDIRTIKEQVQGHQVGDAIPITVLRQGQTLELTLTLEEMPENYGNLGRPRRGSRLPNYAPNYSPEYAPEQEQEERP